MILVLGDSWTDGYGIDKKKSWPSLLAKITKREVSTVAHCGTDNETICDYAVDNIVKYKPEICIIGWSGITRIKQSDIPYIQFSLSQVPEEDTTNRAEYFANCTLDKIRENWLWQINTVKQACKNTKLIMFSVFGDQHLLGTDDLLKISMLEYLADRQNTQLQYHIPVFEFDFLHEDNKVAEEFASREFDKNWQRACVEREDLRGTKFFLDCGHPTSAAHMAWAKYMSKQI